LATRRRAKNLQPADVVFSAKRTQPPPQLISEVCLRSSPHSGRIAPPHVYFKANLPRWVMSFLTASLEHTAQQVPPIPRPPGVQALQSSGSSSATVPMGVLL
jgi:hypothetical protein